MNVYKDHVDIKKDHEEENGECFVGLIYLGHLSLHLQRLCLAVFHCSIASCFPALSSLFQAYLCALGC